MTHISYETSKMLKEFLVNSAPLPLVDDWYGLEPLDIRYSCPKYMLHDILSKPFCKAVSLKRYGKNIWDLKIFRELSDRYYSGGLPSVELALKEMMK